ncbi:hypothetical protein PHMEG_00025650 [Phytophthora megakarya]|uniref:Uncharacterized protein n=1 Tax=Phytophthora megakarya TaxID=4795 RepID=A0A225VCZ4_9STRA|nr:hypothetical protein PHMEG_00025650 [Phytophthora megakarya]
MPSEKRGLLSSPDSSVKRRRMPSRKIAEPAETQDDSVLFKEIWRVLRRKGWTAKPPPLRSLDCRFRYAKPGCSVDGDEGVDYFLGETVLVNYYFTSEDSEVTSFGGPRVCPSIDAKLLPQKKFLKEDYCMAKETNPMVVSPSSQHVVLQVLSSVTGPPTTSPCAVINGVTIGVMEEANYW